MLAIADVFQLKHIQVTRAKVGTLVITLKVKLGTVWNADIELLDVATLEEIHFAIQQAFDFDNDHLFEFFVARNYRAQDKTRFDYENGLVDRTQIGQLFPLPPDRKLFYLFDSWIFQIAKSRKKPHSPVDGVEYPRVVKETGEKPEQYEHDWDE